MASWITSTFAICVLAAVCMALEPFGEFHQFQEAALGGEELLEHHTPELLHHEHKPATSYQNFNLESKHPVPVVIKKEVPHHEEIAFEHEGLEGFEEGFKGF